MAHEDDDDDDDDDDDEDDDDDDDDDSPINAITLKITCQGQGKRRCVIGLGESRRRGPDPQCSCARCLSKGPRKHHHVSSSSNQLLQA